MPGGQGLQVAVLHTGKTNWIQAQGIQEAPVGPQPVGQGVGAKLVPASGGRLSSLHPSCPSQILLFEPPGNPPDSREWLMPEPWSGSLLAWSFPVSFQSLPQEAHRACSLL